MEDDGIEVELEDGTIISSKVHLILATGDLPQADSLAHHRGHLHRAGCRICKITGVHNEKGHGIYFIDHSGVSEHWRTRQSLILGTEVSN